MTQDPRRLSDDPAAPELARALREAQGDVLSPEAVARVQSALMATGLAAAGGASAGATAKLLAGVTGLQIGLATLGLVGLAGLAGVAAMRHTPSAPTSAFAPMDTASAPPPAEVSASPAADGLPAGEPPAIPVATAGARAPTRPTAARPPAEPSPREGALLLEARRALGADPARALALVHAHEREFPRSQLGPERARIAAEARQRLEK